MLAHPCGASSNPIRMLDQTGLSPDLLAGGSATHLSTFPPGQSPALAMARSVLGYSGSRQTSGSGPVRLYLNPARYRMEREQALCGPPDTAEAARRRQRHSHLGSCRWSCRVGSAAPVSCRCGGSSPCFGCDISGRAYLRAGRLPPWRGDLLREGHLEAAACAPSM